MVFKFNRVSPYRKKNTLNATSMCRDISERLSVKHKLAGVVKNLVQKSQFTLFWDVVPRIPPPPPENWNLGRSWHFKTFHFWLVENTPPPHKKWNLGRCWHFKTFHFWLVENPPPPQRKLKFRQILAFQDFPLLTCGEYPPPPPNWNLGRSWHFMTFEFWLSQNTTPPANWAPRRYVETNICIPRGYRLVVTLFARVSDLWRLRTTTDTMRHI